MENRWQHKGHPRGQHLLSPCEEYAMVQIPKNSSSYWEVWLKQLGWTLHYNTHTPAQTLFVQLRDPVERWVAGIAEYCYLYHNDHELKNSTAIRLFEDRVVFDDHTECQCYFYNCFSHQSCVYFNSNTPDAMWSWLEKYTEYQRPVQKYLLDPINYTEDPINVERKDWKNWVQESIDLNKIKQYYEQYDADTYRILNG